MKSWQCFNHYSSININYPHLTVIKWALFFLFQDYQNSEQIIGYDKEEDKTFLYAYLLYNQINFNRLWGIWIHNQVKQNIWLLNLQDRAYIVVISKYAFYEYNYQTIFKLKNKLNSKLNQT